MLIASMIDQRQLMPEPLDYASPAVKGSKPLLGRVCVFLGILFFTSSLAHIVLRMVGSKHPHEYERIDDWLFAIAVTSFLTGCWFCLTAISKRATRTRAAEISTIVFSTVWLIIFLLRMIVK